MDFGPQVGGPDGGLCKPHRLDSDGKVDSPLSTVRNIPIAPDVPLFSLVLTNGPAPKRFIRNQERRLVVFPNAGLRYDVIDADLNKPAVMMGSLPNGASSETMLNHRDYDDRISGRDHLA